MRIIDEVQLDFNDVLIQPKRSTLNSRSEVEIEREFSWVDGNGTKRSFKCIPITAANMGTVGTIRCAEELVKHGYLSCLEKHIPADDIIAFFEKLTQQAILELKHDHEFYTSHIFLSVGATESLDTIQKVYDKFPYSDFKINIDVPNGYTPHFMERVRECRAKFPGTFIVAGTVVTGDAVQDLLMAGANCVRVGIGAGCFHGDMLVQTENGLVQIKNIKVGDRVLTHTGKYKEVVNKFIFNDHKKIIDINGIKCTPNHKFYVANISDIDKINEKNYKDFCYWVEAKDLDETKQKLLKIS